MAENKLLTEVLPTPGQPSSKPEPSCDMSTKCLACGAQMLPEHAHYKCPRCGSRDSCCM